MKLCDFLQIISSKVETKYKTKYETLAYLGSVFFSKESWVSTELPNNNNHNNNNNYFISISIP